MSKKYKNQCETCYHLIQILETLDSYCELGLSKTLIDCEDYINGSDSEHRMEFN